MIVRSAQVDSLSAGMRDQQARRLAAHLRKQYPEKLATVSEDALTAMVSEGIGKAAAYGVRLEFDVRRYAEYMVEFSRDFDVRADWAAQILNGNETGTEKIDKLDAYTTFELRRSPR